LSLPCFQATPQEQWEGQSEASPVGGRREEGASGAKQLQQQKLEQQSGT